MDFSDESRLKLRSQSNISTFITLIVLNSGAPMKRYQEDDLLLMTHISIPPAASIDEFGNIVDDLMKVKFPEYKGDYMCDCLDDDVKRGVRQGVQMIRSKQITVDEMTPTFILCLIGRIFVLLKSRLNDDDPKSSRVNILQVDSRDRKERNSVAKHSLRHSPLTGDEDTSSFSSDDELLVTSPNTSRRARRGSSSSMFPGAENLNDTLLQIFDTINRLSR